MKNTNIRYGIAISSFSTILTIIFLFSRARNILTQDFYEVFLPFVLIITLFLWSITWLETRSSELNRPFGFNEISQGSPLSRLPLALKFGIGAALALIFSLGAINLGSAIIDIPQPFTQQYMAVVSDFDKVFYQSFIPGFFEEAAIYIIVKCVAFILLLLLNKKNNLGIQAVSAMMGALVLTMGHSFVYGSDQGAYIGIFIFESVVQFVNLFTGAFISFIPHVVHNAVVSLTLMVAFSIGGTALIFIPYGRRK